MEKEIETSRILPFSPNAIFAAFADPNRLAIWWGPDGFTNHFEIFEFRDGGRWKFVMQGPDGTRYPNDSRFMTVELGRKVVVDHISPPRFTLTVSLDPCAGGTHIGWHQAFEDPNVASALRPICEPANEQNLDRLHRHLQASQAAQETP